MELTEKTKGDLLKQFCEKVPVNIMQNVNGTKNQQSCQTSISKSVFLIPYEDLEKHFTAPKIISPFYKDVKRVPRKFKKKWKHILCGDRYDFLELGQKLWYIQSLTNPNYNRFLIKQVCLETLTNGYYLQPK